MESETITKKIIDDVCEHPKLKRNMVWCRHCGKSKRIDNKVAMRNGYPKCCGYTMTIDSPDEWN